MRPFVRCKLFFFNHFLTFSKFNIIDMTDLPNVTSGASTTLDPQTLISEELKNSITTLRTQLEERAKSSNINDLKDAQVLMHEVPTVEFIAGLQGIDDSIKTAKMDRLFIGSLLQVYAKLAEDLDLKISQAVDELGDFAPLVLDRLTDGGYGAFARFNYYYYTGASSLKKNKYVRYMNFWVAVIRYSHLIIALTLLSLLAMNHLNGKLPFVQAQLSLVAKMLFIFVITWGSVVAYIPEYVYLTFSNQPFSRWIRRILTGAPANAPESEIQEKYNTFLELRKNILSIRMELRKHLRQMLHLAKTGQFETHYWSVITFDEMTDALTRDYILTYQDRNVLLILLGLSQTLPLLTDPNFLVGIAPLLWRTRGYALVVASIATVLANLFIFDYLKSIPFAKILL